ncbi:hypothetical protein Vi05172_g9983 [Venturia inaequalis]|nr:hypothetical protein Vi05172_g9983 [Venturia inaequalis]
MNLDQDHSICQQSIGPCPFLAQKSSIAQEMTVSVQHADIQSFQVADSWNKDDIRPHAKHADDMDLDPEEPSDTQGIELYPDEPTLEEYQRAERFHIKVICKIQDEKKKLQEELAKKGEEKLLMEKTLRIRIQEQELDIQNLRDDLQKSKGKIQEQEVEIQGPVDDIEMLENDRKEKHQDKQPAGSLLEEDTKGNVVESPPQRPVLDASGAAPSSTAPVAATLAFNQQPKAVTLQVMIIVPPSTIYANILKKKQDQVEPEVEASTTKATTKIATETSAARNEATDTNGAAGNGSIRTSVASISLKRKAGTTNDNVPLPPRYKTCGRCGTRSHPAMFLHKVNMCPVSRCLKKCRRGTSNDIKYAKGFWRQHLQYENSSDL